jgi:hypothetical protein
MSDGGPGPGLHPPGHLSCLPVACVGLHSSLLALPPATQTLFVYPSLIISWVGMLLAWAGGVRHRWIMSACWSMLDAHVQLALRWIVARPLAVAYSHSRPPSSITTYQSIVPHSKATMYNTFPRCPPMHKRALYPHPTQTLPQITRSVSTRHSPACPGGPSIVSGCGCGCGLGLRLWQPCCASRLIPKTQRVPER